MERGRRDVEQEDASLLLEPGGQPESEGQDGPDGAALRRVRMPIARVASRPALGARPSPLIAALAAVIRDAMESPPDSRG